MRSRRFIIAILAMILIFILGYCGHESAVMAIASVAIAVAGAGAADTFSEKKFQQPPPVLKSKDPIPPSPKCLDEE